HRGQDHRGRPERRRPPAEKPTRRHPATSSPSHSHHVESSNDYAMLWVPNDEGPQPRPRSGLPWQGDGQAMVSADASGGSRDLGTLLRRSILGSAALATLLFALPLAFAVSGLYRAQAFAQLAREAERARAVVSDESLAADAGPLLLP